MKNRIYFFANFGEWDKQPYGGGEVGNRRTLELLRQMDCEVRVIESYVKVPRDSVWDKIRFSFRVAKAVSKYTMILMFGRRNHSLLHVVGFYGEKLPFDYLMVSIGKLLGYPVIYEMRGGGADYFYNTFGLKYRKMFNNIVNKSDYIFSQGKENETLILSINPSKHIFYYPNYVMDDFYPEAFPNKPVDKINIIYFGRISPKKNVHVVVKTFSLLKKKYDNINLFLVGNYEDQSYFDYLKRLIKDSRIEDYVTILPACSHEGLKSILRDKHIYVFPTSEPREGHSNAMTEAMAWGLVPVATAHGFNGSVLGQSDLIVNEVNVEGFANVIDSLISEGKLEAISRTLYERVGLMYVQNVAFNRLNDEYSRLFRLFD